MDNCIECKWYNAEAFGGCTFLKGRIGKKRLEKHASLRDEVRCKKFEEKKNCANCLRFYKGCDKKEAEAKEGSLVCGKWEHYIEGKSW
jgi:hypothetical protein